MSHDSDRDRIQALEDDVASLFKLLQSGKRERHDLAQVVQPLLDAHEARLAEAKARADKDELRALVEEVTGRHSIPDIPKHRPLRKSLIAQAQGVSFKTWAAFVLAIIAAIFAGLAQLK